MKKIFYYAAILFAGVTLAACGDDDEDTNPGKTALEEDIPELTELTATDDGASYYTDGALLFDVINADMNAAAVIGAKDKDNIVEANIPAKVRIEGMTYSVMVINSKAFKDCTALKSVNIPGSVQSFGDFAFSNCTALTSATIGDGVQVIACAAFSNCTALESVNIGDGVQVIAYAAFSNCTALESVNIPGSVQSIGDHAFWDCVSLTSIDIPGSVQSIGDYAFINCTALKSITIPTSVTSIGENAFQACDALKSVTALRTDPEAYNCSSAFSVYNISSATLHVPAGCTEVYKALRPWSQFGTIKDDAR